MPKVSSAYETKTITLPSYPDSQVLIKTKVLVEDLIESDQKEGWSEYLCITSRMIKEWNFFDDQEQPLPINEDTLKQFPEEDLRFLMQEIKEFTQKKTPSDKTS